MSDLYSNIPVGKTFVNLDLEQWIKHERENSLVLILCVDNPYSDYDALRNDVTEKEVTEAIDWIIKNENQKGLKGYTKSQIKNLHKKISELMA